MRTIPFDSCFLAFLAVNYLLCALPCTAAAGTSSPQKLESANLYEIFLHQYEKSAPGRWDAPRSEVTYYQSKGLKFDPQVQLSTSRQANGDPLGKLGTQAYDYSVSQATPWGTTLSGFYTENSSTFTTTDQNNPTLSTTTTPTSKAAGVRLSQQLLKDGPFGGLLTDKLASLDRDIASIDAQVKKDDALFQVINSFLNYDLAHKSVAQSQSALDSAAKQNAIVHQLVAGGYKPRADILVSDGVELRARQDLAAAQEAERAALDDLKDHLFWAQNDGQLEVGDTRIAAPFMGRLDHLVKAPFQDTPQGILAAQRHERAGLNVTKATRDNLPNLSVGYTTQKNLAVTDGQSGESGKTNSVTLELSMPVGTMIGPNSLTLARIDAQSSTDELTNQKETDRRTDERLLREVTLKEAGYAAELKLYEYSLKSLEIERQKYSDGKSSISDLKTYQDQSDQATRRLDEAAKALTLAKFNLAHHRGELVKVFVP